MEEIKPEQLQGIIMEAERAVSEGRKTAKEVLEDLARTGLFLFHGSVNDQISELEPRQAYNFGKPDGAPAVFADTSADIAIFKSIITKVQLTLKKEKNRAGWENKNSSLLFYASDNVLEFMNNNPNIKGTVYLLDKRDFILDSRGFISTEPVRVLAELNVSISDLPTNIVERN